MHRPKPGRRSRGSASKASFPRDGDRLARAGHHTHPRGSAAAASGSSARLVEVEQATSGPASGRVREWTDEVRRRLGELQYALEEHIAVTERPGGLYEEIQAQAPQLAGKVRRVGAEHAGLRESVSMLLSRFESTPIGNGWPLEDARADVQRLLGKLVRHRQIGADLVWEAYSVDIGSVD